MSKPTAKTIAPDELLNMALAVLKADRFPYLATIDGDQPRVRPASRVHTDGLTGYVANLRSYHRTGEIAANPNGGLSDLDERHDQVRITGVASVVTHRATRQLIWDTNP